MGITTALPIMEFVAPTLANNSYTAFNWTYVNITSSEDINRSFIEWGNLSGFTNVSMLNDSLINWHINMTELADGIYNYTIWAENTTGDWNQSIRQFVIIDTVLPAVYILSPKNTTYTDKVIELNVSAADDSPLDAWQYSLNGAPNTTFVPNTTIIIAPGANNIGVYVNDSAGNVNGSIVYFTLNTTMEVNLSEPIATETTLFAQNTTFLVNATIICRQGSCANVSGTILYNQTSANPDTPISSVAGTDPFFINETLASSTKSCAEILSEGSICNLTWIINATDSTLSSWKLGVNFSSNSTWTTPNETSFATVSIVDCFIDITAQWASIDFQNPLAPNTYQNPALGNAGDEYNITINQGSCNTDLYIKGTNMENSSLGYSLGVGNLTWSNTSSAYSSSFNMTQTYNPLKIDVASFTNITTWYWLNVPPIYAANYNGTVFIQGVKSGSAPP
ncbi:MAG: hypothetical protein KKE71_00385 [Nanoarchaeota archaeon]|nr:hypothetical protein [Nanoarchaeota archaeon]